MVKVFALLNHGSNVEDCDESATLDQEMKSVE